VSREIFIQATPHHLKDPIYWSFRCRQIAEAFEKKNYKISIFKKDTLSKNILDVRTPVAGSISSVRTALKLLGIVPPKNVDIPEELAKFTNRKIWESTSTEVFNNQKVVHVKSLHEQKKFVGFVYDPTAEWMSDKIASLPKHYPLLVSQVVKFAAETRVYVLDKQIINEDHIRTLLSTGANSFIALAKQIIKEYTQAPRAWVVDIAWMNNHCWSLVEINSAWSSCVNKLNPEMRAQFYQTAWNDLTIPTESV
jgi:hypothetical protein